MVAYLERTRKSVLVRAEEMIEAQGQGRRGQRAVRGGRYEVRRVSH